MDCMRVLIHSGEYPSSKYLSLARSTASAGFTISSSRSSANSANHCLKVSACGELID